MTVAGFDVMIDRDRSLRIRHGYTKRLPTLPFANSTLSTWRRRLVFHKMKTKMSSLSHAIVFRLFNFKKCTFSLSSQTLSRFPRCRLESHGGADCCSTCSPNRLFVWSENIPDQIIVYFKTCAQQFNFEENVFASELTISQDFVRHCPKLRAHGPILHSGAMFQYLLAIFNDEATQKVRRGKRILFMNQECL